MPKYLTPTEAADRRTKNRLKENGPIFNISREMPVVCFEEGQTRARLLSSLKNDWVGWVPADHIRIQSLEDVGWNEDDLYIFMTTNKTRYVPKRNQRNLNR